MTSHIKPQPSLTEKRYVAYYRKLIQELLWADLHFKLWQRLGGLRKGMPIGITFFSASQKAHYDAMLGHLFRVLDTNSKSLSIWKFLNYAESNIKIFSTQAFVQRNRKDTNSDYRSKYHVPATNKNLKDDRIRLAELEEQLKVLKQLRDKVYAHADIRLIRSDSEVRLRKLTIQETEKLITTVFEIIQRYSIAYDKSGYSRKWMDEDDINAVVEILNEGIQERATRAKRLITGE